MSDKTWKAVERRVATRFNTRRNPLSGINSGNSASDSLHESLYIETKSRKKHGLCSLYRDVRKKAAKEGKTPVICIHEHNQRGFLVCLHVEDIQRFCEIMSNENRDYSPYRNT